MTSQTRDSVGVGGPPAVCSAGCRPRRMKSLTPTTRFGKVDHMTCGPKPALCTAIGIGDLAYDLRANCRLQADRVILESGRILIEFDESEFSLQILDDPDPQWCRMVVTATVRGPASSLETWWSQWSISLPCNSVLDRAVHEISQKRREFRRIVSENFRRSVSLVD